jgi:hypothetical protein
MVLPVGAKQRLAEKGKGKVGNDMSVNGFEKLQHTPGNLEGYT